MYNNMWNKPTIYDIIKKTTIKYNDTKLICTCSSRAGNIIVVVNKQNEELLNELYDIIQDHYGLYSVICEIKKGIYRAQKAIMYKFILTKR